MNTTEETVSLIDIITPISAIMVALLTCIGTLIAYKIKSSRGSDGVTLRVENKCSNTDIDRFIRYAKENGVSISDDVRVRDVMDTVQKLNPELVHTNEYKYIQEGMIGLDDDEVRTAVTNLLSLILDYIHV